MGLELPGWLTEPLSWVGLPWPEADEEKLFEAGRAWISFGAALAPVASQADQVATRVWSDNEGPPTEAFQQWWRAEDGPTRLLADDQIAATLVGAALVVFAAITLAMKILFIAQLIALAAAVAAAIAAAFLSFGASTGAIPGFVAAARAACTRILQQVIQVVSRNIGRLLTRSRLLFKKVVSRRGAHNVGAFLRDTWHRGTFPNRLQSLRYHLRKHGKGRTASEYTRDAMDFFSRYRNQGTPVTLKDGTPGIRIRVTINGKVGRRLLDARW